MTRQIVLRHTVVVPASLDEVYRYTQDFEQRPTWDRTILSAQVLDGGPSRRVRVVFRAGRGREQATFVYKAEQADDSYRRTTSVTMTEIQSGMIEAGGGAWTYEVDGAGTRWTQASSITLSKSFGWPLLRGVLTLAIGRELRRGMQTVVRHFASRCVTPSGRDLRGRAPSPR